MIFFRIVLLLFTSISQVLCTSDVSCILCRSSVIATQSVFESNYHHILLDYAPLVQGHLLIVPKRHVVKAHELTAEEWEELSIIMVKIVDAFKISLNTDQYMVLEKNGPKAYQDIAHVHFHILPIQDQRWTEIFIKNPRKLTSEELSQEVKSYRHYLNHSPHTQHVM